ncbi:DUF2934 domain-containing protein [Thetidibacter halocola]|uniref:DUF2934 domain-containing protein n=1 Tax=Thetidibacter halocola TaxID=2827239 RepID=A0A8J7WF50_9RHOB|nr:DUF2934 domain-containing protein [Thetidibacter halocola]MBS0123928.1 DUF2934 domain-containing protein [Thetidibacter halocola]
MPRTLPDSARIAETAYLIWLDEGRPEGRDLDHWLRAQEVLSAEKKPARKASSKKPAPKAAAKPRARKAATTPAT